MMIESRVAEEIFAELPAYRRGLVFATNIDNTQDNPELHTQLKEAMAERHAKPIDLSTDERVESWNAVHRWMGNNPNKFPPAHVALLKRVQGGAKVPFISNVVAIMTIASINAGIPCGGDDLDTLGTSVCLRRADGGELFTPLGSADSESVPRGEIIYASSSGVVACRRWNWRNGHPSRIRPETRSLLMNVDWIMGDTGHVETVRDRIAEMLAKYCKATVRTGLLSPDSPVCRL